MKIKNLYKYLESFKQSVLFKAGYNIKNLFVFKSEGDQNGIKTQIWLKSVIAQGLLEKCPLYFKRSYKSKKYPEGKTCEFGKMGNWVRGNSEDYKVIIDMGLKYYNDLFILRNGELDIKPSRRKFVGVK